MMMVFAIGALTAGLLVSLLLNCLLVRTMYKEHEKTCTRLMCKDVAEYKAITEDSEKQQVETPHQKALRKWREKGNG